MHVVSSVSVSFGSFVCQKRVVVFLSLYHYHHYYFLSYNHLREWTSLAPLNIVVVVIIIYYILLVVVQLYN